nr:hypothetical protein [Tanacetum cinerariifolium]
MGEPLSLDRVFDFLKDELEPHPAYDLFTPAPLPGYVGNPNNKNGWLTADDYLLGELEAIVGEQMVVPAIDEVAEPIVEAEEEQVITLVADMKEGQMDVLMIDMEEDLAEEAWEVNEEWLMAPVTPPSVLAMQPSSVYKVGAGVTIEELGSRIYAVEGQVQVMATPAIPVSAQENLGDPIDIKMDIIHPEVVTAVAFPAVAVELTALRFRVDIAEAENASLRAKIKTTEAIEKITRKRERQACVEIEQQLAAV